jgi:hypothetical protein
MKDLSKQKFEESWKKSFEGAEVDPPASIWSAIELDLVRGESDLMKKQVLIYKWLAAASVFLVVFLGGIFYYAGKTEGQQPLSIHEEVPEGSSTAHGGNKQIQDNTQDATIARGNVESEQSAKGRMKILASQKAGETNRKANVVQTEKTEPQVLQKEQAGTAKNGMSPISRSEAVASVSSIEEILAVVHGKMELPRLVLPAMPAAFMSSSKKKKSSEEVWASVGFSAGSYNPRSGQTSQAFSSTGSPQDALKASYLNDVGYSDRSKLGSAYSAGFAMSKRVFNRWVLQSGVNYLNQNIGYTSNYVSISPGNQSRAFLPEYADLANQSVTITTPYEINSAIEVISLPFQTGYLIVDRKIGWQLNTGVAADFFVRNTLTDASGRTDRLSQRAGEKSPYRTMSWAGLLGTELSYKVASHYRISVVPSMRYSVNSVLKTNSGPASNPLVMDIGLRFRYIFK